MFCWLLFVLLYFFFWPLCCLFFFDIRILIAPLISSNSSWNWNKLDVKCLIFSFLPVSINWYDILQVVLSYLFPVEKSIKDNAGDYLNCKGRGGVLYIESATYGPAFYILCNNTNVKPFIDEKCHGKEKCHITLETIGVDPCPEKPKVLIIRYGCMTHTGKGPTI
jgi:hypothetical protein